MQRILTTLTVLLLTPLSPLCAGELKLAAMFSDHMILQRDRPVPVWGWADTCEDVDLHPLNKQDAGYRLALAALANTYGFKELAWSGPVYRSLTIQDGKALVKFHHVGHGLLAKKLPAAYRINLRTPELGEKRLELPSPSSEIQGFAICGADRNWVWAEAKIEGSTVLVWSDKVLQPVAVRYAWADHPVCNL